MGHDFPEGKLALVHSVYAAVAVLFNVVAASHALTWRKFTVNNPILGSVAVVIVYAITIAVLVGGGHDALGLYGAICLLFGLLLANGGILKHLRAPYGRMEEYHSHAWKLGVLINVFGVGNYATGFYYVADGGELGEPGFYATLIVVVALVAVVILKRKLGKKPTDAAWYDATAGVDATRTCKRHAELTSQYVTMSDGCRIAVDVHLPLWWGKPGVNSPPLPTVLHLTRYGRNFAVKRSCRWLLGRYFNMRSLRYVAKLIPRGYAWVSVDVRSTGASFGTKMCDLLPRETADYQEVLKWVKRQPWCNGNVGTGGISYDGIAGTILASGGGVKAVASVFAPQDIYKDLVAAGGVLAAGFVDTYGKFTMAGERNQPVRGVQTPALYRLLTKHFLDGVLPVDATTNDLANAIAEHHGNWDMARQLRRVHYRDDPLVAVPSNQVDAATAPPGSVLAPEDVEGDWDLGTGMDADGGYSVLTVGFFGLNTPPIIEGLTRHKVVVHSWTGYFDSCQTVSTSRLHAQLPPGYSHITMGPWSHGGRRNCSPHSPAPGPGFDIFEDIARFFDRELIGAAGGSDAIATRPVDVNYFVMGVEQWNSAPAWPVPGRTAMKLYLGAVDSLSPQPQVGTSCHPVPMDARTCVESRWNLVEAMFLKVIHAGDRAAAGRRVITFDSAPLDRDVVLVGQPLVRLVLQPNKPDTVVFAYLDDVAPAGQVFNVTEGVLRASNRPWQAGISEAKAGGDDGGASVTSAGDAQVQLALDGPVPGMGEEGIDATTHYTFNRGDNHPLSTTSPETIDVPLVTTCYTFKRGHCVRVALAGADLDNFDTASLPTELATEWTLHFGAEGSFLQLPIMQ